MKVLVGTEHIQVTARSVSDRRGRESLSAEVVCMFRRGESGNLRYASQKGAQEVCRRWAERGLAWVQNVGEKLSEVGRSQIDIGLINHDKRFRFCSSVLGSHWRVPCLSYLTGLVWLGLIYTLKGHFDCHGGMNWKRKKGSKKTFSWIQSDSSTNWVIAGKKVKCDQNWHPL